MACRPKNRLHGKETFRKKEKKKPRERERERDSGGVNYKKCTMLRYSEEGLIQSSLTDEMFI